MIDFDEWQFLNKTFPMLLFPAFQLQDIMQKKVHGERFWVRKLELVRQEAKILEYQNSHDGAVPRVPFCKRLDMCLCPWRYRGFLPRTNKVCANVPGQRVRHRWRAGRLLPWPGSPPRLDTRTSTNAMSAVLVLASSPRSGSRSKWPNSRRAARNSPRTRRTPSAWAWGWA